MEVMTVSPLEIQLDTRNPRFIIPPNQSQDYLRSYLFEFGKIDKLLESIINYGGLIPGERIIVIKENDSLIAFEGNRRICACHLILKPELIPEKWNIPPIFDKVKSSIEKIEVDFIPDRKSALNILAIRHIEGIKDWNRMSKLKFFANLFEEGKSIEEIKEITTPDDKKNIKSNLQEYYLLKYALDLPVWDDKDKAILFNVNKLEPTKFYRIFNAKVNGYSVREEIIGLDFDPITLNPTYTISKEKFDKLIELIARAAFITNEIDTRSTLKDVPGIESVIEIPSLPKSKVYKKRKQPDNEQLELGIDEPKIPQGGNYSPTTLQPLLPPQPQEPKKPVAPPIQKPPLFFSDIVCNIKNTDPDGVGVLAVVREIEKISNGRGLDDYPIACSALLRVLIEQTLKYHLKKIDINAWNAFKAKSRIGDPSLQNIIDYIKNNLDQVFIDKTVQRNFTSVFNNPGLKESLDLVIHHTNLVRLNKQTLIAFSEAGLRSLIEYIINYNHVGAGQNP